MNSSGRGYLLTASALVAWGCSQSAHNVEARSRASDAVEFVVSDVSDVGTSTVRFARVERTGLAVTRSVSVPARVAQIESFGREAVVLLGRSDCSAGCKKSEHDGEVGVVSPTGYRRLPLPSREVWAAKQDPLPAPPTMRSNEQHFEAPWWTLVVTAANEVWIGRCEWGWATDDVGCDEWAYSRLMPTPELTTLSRPEAIPQATYPVIAPSSAIRLEFVSGVAPPEAETKAITAATGSVFANQYLRCTDGTTVEEFPAEHERAYYCGVGSLMWISNEPPMFQLDVCSTGMSYYNIRTVFEGCTKSKALAGAVLTGGPSDTLAILVDGHLSLRQRGKEIGTMENVRAIRFFSIAR